MSEEISRELVIKVIRDDSEARRQAEAYWEVERKGRERAAAADKGMAASSKAAGQAKADAAKEADQLIAQLDKEAAARQKAEAKAKVARQKETNAAIRQADKVMSDLIMADLKAIVAADAETAKARKASAADVAKVIRQVEAQTAADKRQWDRRELTDEEVQQRGISGIIRQANKDRVRDFIAAHGQEKSLLGDLKSAWDAKVGSITAGGPAVAGLTVAMAGLKVGVDIIGALDEKMKFLIESTRESTKALVENHKAHLELAGFADTPGQTAAQELMTAKLAAASGLPLAEARNLRRSAEAGAYAILDKPGKQGLMSREDFEKVEVSAAKWAAVSGGDAADYGKAVAMIPSLEGRRMTAGEVEGDMIRMDKLATIAGFESPSDLVKQVQGVSGYIKSGVVSSKIAQGLTAIAAKTSPGEAGTIVEQMMTALSAGALMDRGVKVPDEFKDQVQTSAAWFKDIGVTRNMRPEDALPKIDEALSKLPAGTNKDQFLLEHGVTNQKSRQGFLMFHGERPTWDKEVMPILNAAIPAGTVDATHADYLKTFGGRARLTEAMGEAATAVEGARFGDLNNAIEAQYDLLKAKGEAAGPLSEYMEPLGRKPWDVPRNIYRYFKGTTPNTLLAPVADSLQEVLRESGQSIGATGHTDRFGNIAATIGDVMTSGARSWQEKGEVFREGLGRAGAAGGDTSLGIEKKLQELIDVMKAIHGTVGGVEKNTKPDTRPRPTPHAPGRPMMPSPRAL